MQKNSEVFINTEISLKLCKFRAGTSYCTNYGTSELPYSVNQAI